MSKPTDEASTSCVLVVDDDAFSRDVMQEMLAAEGVTDIQMADNGRSALRALEAMPTPPDLLICDVFMPDMDGIEFVSELAQRQYTGAVVLVTGVDAQTLALARDLATGQGIRLLGSFTKPLHQHDLAQMLAAR
jgi:CheY-like chemotaxis protein